MKDYDCSCFAEYPNKSHILKNGKWKCVDKYEKIEDWEPKSIYGCVTHCRRKENRMNEIEKELKDSKARIREYKRMVNNIELIRSALLRSVATEALNITAYKKQLKEKNNGIL